jgi:transposase
LSISYGTIRRRYDQGLDSIVRLVIQLEDRIEDLILTEAQQLNVQLQARIRELEKSIEEGSVEPVPVIKRDSHNSNQSLSLDLPWTKPKRTRSLRKQSGLKVGGQPGHAGVTLQMITIPNRIIEHMTNDCSHCGISLVSVDSSRYFRRQVFEIENGGLAVIEHRVSTKVCPTCGNLSKGQFPIFVKAPVQYGASVFSRALYLHLYQLLPVARTQEAMRDLFGCEISQASIQRAARICSDKLVRCEQRIKAAIRDSAVIGADETGTRINGTNAWVHVARTDSLTHLASHTHRGKAAFNAIGILNQFKGTLVRNSSLLELDSELQKDFLSRYGTLIAKAEEAVRGSPKLKSVGLTAANLLNRFIKSKAEVLRFMTDFAVPFDNNGSERDLRMLKLQQKIAGCFRTTEGVITFCRVRSYLASARKQGKGLLTAIEHALKGKPINLT